LRGAGSESPPEWVSLLQVETSAAKFRIPTISGMMVVWHVFVLLAFVTGFALFVRVYLQKSFDFQSVVSGEKETPIWAYISKRKRESTKLNELDTPGISFLEMSHRSSDISLPPPQKGRLGS